ncbi:MAG TPA: HlyD family secretion protein [Gammaproteobacteria bacterium]|jgi:multidrug resistance efflux pump
MEILMLMTYTGFCWAVFKIFKLPINKWTIPTAILGGFVLIGLVLLFMNYNHPYSTLVRQFYITTPIVPNVEGQVVEVPVQANVPLKRGEVLFRLDPRPFEFEVQRLEAELANANTGAAQLDQRLRGAQAGTARSVQAKEEARAAIAQVSAQLELARTNEARQRELVDRGLVAQIDYDRAKRQMESLAAQLQAMQASERQAEQAISESRASEEEARLAFQSESGGMNPEVRRIQSQLDRARWELEQSVIRAPTDGMVTQLFLRPGMRAVPLPLRPVMSFVHSEEGDKALVGAFWQNSLQRIRAGDEAEVIFKGVPGRVFKGKVDRVLPVVAQGQLTTAGQLQAVEAITGVGKIPVVIQLEDDLSPYHLPLGVVGSGAIYTEHAHHVAIIRKILLRMVSWQNYIFGELH